jgi:hypothetical protein
VGKLIKKTTKKQLVLILGDLNCNILKPEPDCKVFQEFTTELNLTNVINRPTRVTVTTIFVIPWI